jgi:hypothetical protein
MLCDTIAHSSRALGCCLIDYLSTKVPKAQNPLAVCDTDGSDVLDRPVPQHLVDVASVLQADKQALHKEFILRDSGTRVA